MPNLLPFEADIPWPSRSHHFSTFIEAHNRYCYKMADHLPNNIGVIQNLLNSARELRTAARSDGGKDLTKQMKKEIEKGCATLETHRMDS